MCVEQENKIFSQAKHMCPILGDESLGGTVRLKGLNKTTKNE